ncbi:MAG: exonuclease domain-containing protein [Lachnospiraceae bacterium]|nr:exonuclease domain-containing protein [Lachnospiraceae bacterium]
MNYIVFDLEWNQSPGGKAKENPKLPFEIIEIGAVKLNENREQIDSFQEIVRPLVYHHLHFRMKEVVPVTEEELMRARTFSRVARDFLKWCGDEEFTFVTWGNLDVMELQRNMDYYRIPNPFPKPLIYIDLQKLYSIRYSDGKKRLALEQAVDEIGIPKDIPFHRALDDAYYTAQVMHAMDYEAVKEYTSVDYFRLPLTKSEEIYLTFPTYSKYVSRVFANKNRAMQDKSVAAISCPKCKLPVWKKIRWFSTGTSGVYLGLAKCPRHGYIKGKIRLKKLPDDSVYAVKTIKNVDSETAEEIRKKRLALREKRRRDRHSK